MDTRKSIISVIDRHFDEYYIKTGANEKFTPYENEENTTLLSFFKKIYSLLKSGSIFEDELLKLTYKECAEDVIKTIKYIKNSKIYKFKIIPDSSKGSNSRAYGLLDCIYTLHKKYTCRNYNKDLDEDEKKLGYEDLYNESIFISKKLIPTYNGNKEGSVEFEIKNNPYLIKINKDGSFVIWNEGEKKEFEDYQNFKDEILKMSSDSSLLNFYTTDRLNNDEEANTTYYITFAFENGFTVDSNNEYEQDGGFLLELFQQVYKSIETNENVLEEYLKKYFYKILVEKYRTKNIIDKETNLKTSDLSATNNYFVFPKVYETLAGKGGKIGNANIIDYDYNDNSYIKLPFEKSILHNDGVIDFYINKVFLTGSLKLLSKYDKIDFDNDINTKSFLYEAYKKNKNTIQLHNSSYINYFDNVDDLGRMGVEEYGKDLNKQNAKYIKLYADKLKKEILKQIFFAVTPKFNPNLKFGEFFKNNVTKIQKEYFYSENQDEIDIDVFFEKKYMVLKIKTKVKPNLDINFGNGVLTIRKTQQKFYDNIVSNLSQTETTTKNSNFKSNEFSSLMDDREISVVATSDTIISLTEFGYSNVDYDNTKTFFINGNFPEFKKTTFYKKNNELWLDCTNFSNYYDLNSISQIRILLTNKNTNRFLFNVDRVVIEKNLKKIKKLEIDIKTEKELCISYIYDEKLNISNELFGNYKEEELVFKNSSFEFIEIEKESTDDYSFNFYFEEPSESYIFGDEINFNSTDGIVEEHKLIINGNFLDEFVCNEKRYLVLKNNHYTNNKLTFNNEIDCQILDVVLNKGNPKRKELGQFVYNSDFNNTPELYKKEKEKSFLKVKIENKNINVYNNLLIDKTKIMSVSSVLNHQKTFGNALFINTLKNYKLYNKFFINLNKLQINKIKVVNIEYELKKQKRPSVKYSQKNIEIQNKGMIFKNEITKDDHGRMLKKEHYLLATKNISSSIDKINIQEVNIDWSFRKDKFIILHSNYKGYSYINNINTVDYKENSINIEKNILTNEGFIYKTNIEELDIKESKKDVVFLENIEFSKELFVNNLSINLIANSESYFKSQTEK